MKPPIPTPEPVPVQTLRRYGLHATADEVAEVYRQHGELVRELENLIQESASNSNAIRCNAACDRARSLLTRINPTQKKG